MSASYNLLGMAMTQVIRSCAPINSCQSYSNANIPNLPIGISANVACNQCTTDNCNNQRTFSSGNKNLFNKLLVLPTLALICMLYFF